jgi:hypothetical protein
MEHRVCHQRVKEPRYLVAACKNPEAEPPCLVSFRYEEITRSDRFVRSQNWRFRRTLCEKGERSLKCNASNTYSQRAGWVAAKKNSK